MKCEQCGAEIKNGEIFCRVCGARVSSASAETARQPSVPDVPGETEAPQQEKRDAEPKKRGAAREPRRSRQEKPKNKKPTNKKLIVLGGAAVIAVAAVVVILVLIFGGRGGGAMRLDPERPFAVMYDNNAIIYDADGNALLDLEHSVDGVKTSVWNSTILLDRDRVNGWNAGGDTAYLGEEYISASSIVMGANGDILRFQDRNDGANEGIVRFDGVSGLDDLNVVDGTVVMSPDGSRTAYNIFDEASDAEHSMIGTPTEKGERLLDCERIYALSNDGVYVYFENNGRFYVEKDGVRTRLCELTDLKLPIVMNAVGDEILFATYSDGVHYVHSGINDKISGTGDVLGPVQYASELREDETVSVTRTETFAGSVLLLGDMLYSVDRETFKTSMLDYCLSAVASEDGSRLVYVDVNGKLHFVSDPCGDRKESVYTPDERATAVYSDYRLDEIYFTNVRDELWRLNGDRGEMVSADVGNLCVSGEGALYFLYDGVVLCRVSGTDRVSLERLDGFVSIESAPQGVVAHLAGDTARYFRDSASEGKTLAKRGPTAGNTEAPSAGPESAEPSADLPGAGTGALPETNGSAEPSSEGSGSPER